MKRKLKALFIGVAMLAIIVAIAGFVNFLILILGTDTFLMGFSVICILYLCFSFGDLYMSFFGSKENKDA